MTDGLTECRVCGQQVAQRAELCPHCGAGTPDAAQKARMDAFVSKVWVPFLIVTGLVFLVIITVLVTRS